jgi:hypothetical protein
MATAARILPALLLALALTGCGPEPGGGSSAPPASNRPRDAAARDTAARNPVAEFAWHDLVREYDNEVAAGKKYGGKDVIVAGLVLQVFSGGGGMAVLRLGGIGGWDEEALCEFPASESDRLAKLKIEEAVAVVGIAPKERRSAHVIRLTRCFLWPVGRHIVSTEPPPRPVVEFLWSDYLKDYASGATDRYAGKPVLIAGPVAEIKDDGTGGAQVWMAGDGKPGRISFKFRLGQVGTLSRIKSGRTALIVGTAPGLLRSGETEAYFKDCYLWPDQAKTIQPQK